MVWSYLLSFVVGLALVIGGVAVLLFVLGLHLWVWFELNELTGWPTRIVLVLLILVVDVLPWVVGLIVLPPWGS